MELMQHPDIRHCGIKPAALIALILAVPLLLVVLLKRSASSENVPGDYRDLIEQDSGYCYVEFTPDSLYRIEYDSVVRVIDARSGKQIREFEVWVNRYPDNPWLKEMLPDPTGKYLAFLDSRNIVSIYNIITGECEGSNDYYFEGNHHIFFSDDGKYLLMVDYREPSVDILHCPDLGYIASSGLGYYRNNIRWEQRNGKLIFYFEVVDSLFKTIFPDDGHGDSLVFGKPEGVDKTESFAEQTVSITQ
jgi:hypothetical protein